MKNALTLSIVIPVYNEEHHIKRCLDAISGQTVQPLEVIVVDNNCTDKTVAIARQYPFVKVIHEPLQGRGYARTAGFSAATGDVIGRIDADSVIMPTWARRVLQDFADPNVGGITGPGQTNILIGVNSLYTTFWSRVYFWTSHAIFDAVTMWGANMAIRRTIWPKVRPALTLDDTLVHEDQDLSLLMLGAGGTIIQDNKLLIKTIGRSYLYWPKFWEYFTRTFRTNSYHIQRQTLARDNPQRIGFWRALPGGILGWLFTVVFIIYSFVTWPLTAAMRRAGKLS